MKNRIELTRMTINQKKKDLYIRQLKEEIQYLKEENTWLNIKNEYYLSEIDVLEKKLEKEKAFRQTLSQFCETPDEYELIKKYKDLPF